MKSSGYLLMLLSMLIQTAVHAEQVAEVKYTRGASTVQKTDGSGARLIAIGDTLQQGEVIKTGKKSFVVLRFIDDTKMTLRPNTSLAIEHMNARDDDKANTTLRLFRGGFRAISGYISKRRPTGYQIKTAVNTIGVRDAEFDARICEEDCGRENITLGKKLEKNRARVIGQVIFKQGDLVAVNYAEQRRVLINRSNLYEGDLIATGDNAYASIAFRDNSRINLQANTRFRIDELRFNDTTPSQASSLFTLLRGGLRTVTGLIGNLNPEKYRMRTRIASIGVQGTSYDLVCSGECSDNKQAIPGLPAGDGLYTYVWDGVISMREQFINRGEAAYVKDLSTAAVVLPQTPDFFIQNSVPRPDNSTKIEFNDVEQQYQVSAGLYLNVKNGSITLAGQASKDVLTIHKGQSGYSDTIGRELIELPATPAFQRLDSTPKPDDFRARLLDIDGTLIDHDEDLLCEIQ